MTIPHIKLTDTMLNKYIIDAKKDILDLFEIDPSGEFDLTWLEPIYISADYESDTGKRGAVSSTAKRAAI